VGDRDGVVVIPAALADEVADDAARQELEEEWAASRIEAGESTAGVFPLGDARRADFETWLVGRRQPHTSS
jgi:regulator of RNase E activity RraA